MKSETVPIERFRELVKTNEKHYQEACTLRSQLKQVEAEAACMREALKEAVSLNYVPEHNQDDEWNERFTKCISALDSTSAGKAFLARMEEAVRLLDAEVMDVDWIKRRDTLLEQLKGGM